MHFGKEIEEDLVPEWRAKYFDYKQAKKRIKAIQRALRNAHRLTPSDGGRATQSAPLPFTHYDFNQPRPQTQEREESPGGHDRDGTSQPMRRPEAARNQSLTMFSTSPPEMAPDGRETPEDTPETQPLQIPGTSGEDYRRRQMRYGSIIGSPPEEPPQALPALQLPGPAMPQHATKRPDSEPSQHDSLSPLTKPPATAPSSGDPYHVGKDRKPRTFPPGLSGRIFDRHHSYSGPRPSKDKHGRSKLRRMFSTTGLASPGKNDVHLDAYRELDSKQAEFFGFLDSELDKIESFYKSKEEEASIRLNTLRQQLHELRDQRVAEMRALKQGKPAHPTGVLGSILPNTIASVTNGKEPAGLNGQHHASALLRPVEDAIRRRSSHVGKTSKAMEHLSSPVVKSQARDEGQKDYTRRHTDNEKIPYHFAKRRLKLALQEFYRGLELLKSYTLLNRTAMRKINKKYDKAVNARPTGRYMSEKVNTANFVTSNIIEGHIVAVEDLYARYFERGNHKIAVGKLRTKLKPADQSSSSFRNGLFVAAAIVFGCFGIINCADHIADENRVLATQAAYLLQLYAGYFLAVILFLMFCVNCMVWRNAKINYIFIFEYDTRTVLDWRQLCEIPCFFLFLNGLFLWLNFRQPISTDGFYLYYFLMLIVASLLILICPIPILYYHARRWWGFSNFRLVLAGLYPVEFRDFYLGDMYCSEIYAMSQIELFFCLYVNNWDNPPKCNSSHSRLLGFFTTLPAIWRAFQCLRRYYDSRNWFPHLANCAKYGGNILYYMSLSLYRIDKSNTNRAVFILFAAINGVYASFWDVAFDFSLGNYYARYPFLRDRLGYRRVWVYYVAIVVDVILRQSWILYAIYTHDIKHGQLLSFFIGLAEVLRRGMWSLFRVENEHCNNVGQFRASRDIPLPYSLPSPQTSPEAMKPRPSPIPEHPSPPSAATTPGTAAAAATATGTDIERTATHDTADGSLRQRRKPPPTPTTPGIRTLQRVGTLITTAHAQDYTKARRDNITGHDGRGRVLQHSPHALAARDGNHPGRPGDSSDDDDDDDETATGIMSGENSEGGTDDDESDGIERVVTTHGEYGDHGDHNHDPEGGRRGGGGEERRTGGGGLHVDVPENSGAGASRGEGEGEGDGGGDADDAGEGRSGSVSGASTGDEDVKDVMEAKRLVNRARD